MLPPPLRLVMGMGLSLWSRGHATVAQGWMWHSGVTCGSGSRYHVPRHPTAPTPCCAEQGKVCPQKPPQGVFAKPEPGTSLLPWGTWTLRVMPPAATAKSLVPAPLNTV